MGKLAAVAGIVVMAAAGPASAYTQADADACTPDAFRLCQYAIPDADRVTVCLTDNKRHLSPACKIVFNRPATARKAPPPGRPLRIHRTDF